MTPPLLDALVGRQLKDSYGRYVGVIAGITTDEVGNILSIGVDTGCHGFKKIDGEQIIFEDETPTTISEWRLKTDNLLKMSEIAQKRMQALEELYQEGEITQEVYEQIASRHKAHFDLYSKDCDDTIANLNAKVDTLKSENNEIQEFLGNLKLQHRINEIDDSTYQVTCEYMGMMLQRNEKEVADISAVLNTLLPPEPSVDAEENASEESTPEVAEENLPEVGNESVAEVTEHSTAPEELVEPAEVEEHAPLETSPVEVTSAMQDAISIPDEQPVSEDIDTTGSETVDTVAMEEASASSDVSVSAPTFKEDLSGDTDSQVVEEPSTNEPITPDTSVEPSPTSPPEAGPTENIRPTEVTDVSDHMPMEETESTADSVAASDDDDSREIQDSVSFEEETIENSETPSSDEESTEVAEAESVESIETPSSDEVAETPDDSVDSEEDKIVYSTQ